MKELIMLKGLPASGKSSWAKEWVLEAPVNSRKRVNKDDLRSMLDGGRWSKGAEELVLHVRDAAVIAALDSGASVVVDDTNLAPKHEDVLKNIADMYGAKFTVKFFDVDIEECIRRDYQRLNPVGEDVIREMYKRWLKPKTKVDTRPVAEQYHGNPTAIICDIDGTIALNQGRGFYDYSKVGEDAPNIPVIELLKDFKEAGHDIIFVSGREGSCYHDTVDWLNEHMLCDWDRLYMRNVGDHREDSIVKNEIYDNFIKGTYWVVGVLDDRDRVVKMWRDNGLLCLQVWEGNF